MSPAALTPHGRASVLIISRRLVGDLVERALDKTSDLSRADRVALLWLALAVDVEASQRVGVAPRASHSSATLSEVSGEIEAS